MNAIPQSEHPVKWIPVQNLSVLWANAQREFNQKEADRIQAEFDPDYFGTITVTLPNGHGIYHVVDGQTRVAAVRGMWGEREQVPCVVVNAEDPKRAAQIFARINSGRKKPSALELFRVAVTAGEPAEVAVDRLVTSMGYVIQKNMADGAIGAVGSCLFVYNQHGLQILRRTFLVMQGAWGKSGDSTDASIIRGIGTLLNENRVIDEQRLVDLIVKNLSPFKLLSSAKGHKERGGGSMAKNISRTLTALYNKGLKEKSRLVDKF